MAACVLLTRGVPGMTTMVVPFLLVFGVSYSSPSSAEMTPSSWPSELYPVSMSATWHGISAGIGKLGASSAFSCSRCEQFPRPARNLMLTPGWPGLASLSTGPDRTRRAPPRIHGTPAPGTRKPTTTPATNPLKSASAA